LINIVASADDNYAQHLGTMLASLLINIRKDKRSCLRIFVLDGGIKEENRRKLNRLNEKYSLNLIYKKVSKKVYEKLHLRKGVSYAAYNKISIPELIREDKIIYIDSDVLVLDDIYKLWKIDISDYYLAACEDLTDHYVELYNIGKGDYFNAGIMVINNKKWRKNNGARKIRNWLEKYNGLTDFHDQDAFNMAFHKKWLKLHPRWNVISTYFFKNKISRSSNIDEIINNPGIIHFSVSKGRSRPWLYWSRHPYKKEYYKYLYKTPWKGFKPTDRSKKLLLKYFRRRFIPIKTRKILDSLLKNLDFMLLRINARVHHEKL
jgi:lipopolysaccharide biosynthesis glycosyltransferase